ncbi:MAG: hypothetical protein AAFR60_07550, partial [Pseudomonadota bacterium]
MTTTQYTRISRALAAAVDAVLDGSHDTKTATLLSAGAKGDGPAGSHQSRYKNWIFETGKDPEIDNFAFIGDLIEEFMDYHPPRRDVQLGSVVYVADDTSDEERDFLVVQLEADGLQYFRGGRIIPTGVAPDPIVTGSRQPVLPLAPDTVDQVLLTVVKGLRRAMGPLEQRRKGSPALTFASEYDVQDLLHVLLRPWVADIRAEEYTPSYAGRSTRVDFLLPAHATVLELKFVRDANHAKKIGEELTIDIAAYAKHPDCQQLWCIVYDPQSFLQNPDGLVNDLDGTRNINGRKLTVKTLI